MTSPKYNANAVNKSTNKHHHTNQQIHHQGSNRTFRVMSRGLGVLP
jgi:hypothetical protein